MTAFWRDRRGGTIVETAIVLGLFLLLVIGIIWTGELLWIQNNLDYTVQQAARCAGVNHIECHDAPSIALYASRTSGFPAGDFTVDLTQGSECPMGYLVRGRYQMSIVLPFVGINPQLTSKACFPKSFAS